MENIGLCDIIDSFAEGVVVHAPDATIVNFNPKSLEILKVTKDQLLGVTPMHPQWKTILPDGSPFPIEKNPAMVTIKTGQPVIKEIMGIVTGEKQVTWLKITSQPVKGKDGVYAVVTFSDITDLHIQNLQYEMAHEGAGVGIWKYDIQANVREWDDSMYRMYGINRADYGGDYKAWESLLHPDDKERGNEEIEMAIKGIKEYDTTFRIITPKKEIRFIRAKGKIIKDSDGEPHLMIGTNWDVTEERNRESQLSIQHQRLAWIIDGTNLATWEWNIQTGETIFNERWAEIIGYSLSELQPVSIDTWLKFAFEEDLPGSEKALKAHFEGKAEYYEYQSRMKHRDGHLIWVFDRGKVFEWDKDGNPLWMFGTHQEISQQKSLEKSLQEAKEKAEKYAQAKASFLANMSHEIRTPMNGILGMADMLRSTHLDAEQQEMADVILGSGKNLLEIINDILDVSAMESGKITFQEEDFDLHKKLNEMVALFRAFGSKNGIEVKLVIDDSTPRYVHSDSTRIGQVISNFLSNAIKFSPEGSSVETFVSFNKSKEEFTFRVTDHGIGMSQTELQNIFDEFYQVDSGVNRMYQGSGLGLAISQRIANLFDGNIEVESEKGLGTTFTFKVRLKTCEEPKILDAQPEYEGVLANEFPHKILVVEDNKVNQTVISKVLSKHGYEIDLAEDGAIAVEMCKKKDYSLILMDLQMPNMDGYCATEEILKGLPDTTIVAMTANVLPEQKERCFQVGMKGFLGKPFTNSKVVDMIRNL